MLHTVCAVASAPGACTAILLSAHLAPHQVTLPQLQLALLKLPCRLELGDPTQLRAPPISAGRKYPLAAAVVPFKSVGRLKLVSASRIAGRSWSATERQRHMHAQGVVETSDGETNPLLRIVFVSLPPHFRSDPSVLIVVLSIALNGIATAMALWQRPHLPQLMTEGVPPGACAARFIRAFYEGYMPPRS
jgi:hypothetical protein